MIPVVLGLAGRRGSGKSTLANVLQSQHGFLRVSFGDYVRSEASARGSPDDVATLEELGQHLIAELGWDRFCAAVLGDFKQSSRVVVDGVRHVAAAETLRRVVAPAHFGLAFIHIDDAVRRHRMRQRARPGDFVEGADLSRELDQLRAQAEVVVDGSHDEATSEIMAWCVSLSQ